MCLIFVAIGILAMGCFAVAHWADVIAAMLNDPWLRPRVQLALSLGLGLALLASWLTSCGMVPTAYYLQGQQQRQQMPAYYNAPAYNPYDNWASNNDALLREERAERIDNWSRFWEATF